MPLPQISVINPPRAIPGSRVSIVGHDFPVGGGDLPDVFVQEKRAGRVCFVRPYFGHRPG
jgi:hypothetical protein